MNILIVDYGLCNTHSVARAVKECGHTPLISGRPEDIRVSDKIIIPGVGNFSQAMANLSKRGWNEVLREAVLTGGTPLLGICLGMQLLATESKESSNTKGLNLVPGKVVKLNEASIKLRIPHIGWNEVIQRRKDFIFDGVNNKKDFYFVHSYHLVPNNSDNILSTTPYGMDFVSAISENNIYGVQFHPEKSLKAGLRLLHNFLIL